MRVAEAALDGGTGTRAAWTKASVDYYLAIHPDEARWRPTGAEEGIPSVEQIRERALVADRANKALRGTSRVDPDPERHDEWSARLGWFDETLSAVFTDEFLAAVAAVKGGDQAGLEYVVRFLEADPWCRRSGYMKASLIPAIARLELNELTRRRLARGRPYGRGRPTSSPGDSALRGARPRCGNPRSPQEPGGASGQRRPSNPIQRSPSSRSDRVTFPDTRRSRRPVSSCR
jgi:hypothetical protein